MSDAGGEQGVRAVEARVRAVEARVRGRVQGVGFRWFVAREARALSLTGWVRNAPDGTVDVAVVGAPDQVERMLSALRRGPPHAVVQSVEVEERASHEGMNLAFEILP